MTTSNRKPAQAKEAPTEPFKRAVGGAMRAIAGRAELDISFANDRPALLGDKARLPEPPRKMTAADAAIVRGHADSMALRLSCHDANVHRRMLPEGQTARAVYDAVEQSRVESIGSRRMDGVAANISAMLEDRFHRGNFHDIRDVADAPIEDAIAMIVRERLTGMAPPPSARAVVDLWRPHIEEKAGETLDTLTGQIGDQRAFSRVVRDLLVKLEMAEQAEGEPEADESENQDEQQSESEEQNQGEAEEQASTEKAEASSAEDSSDDIEDGTAGGYGFRRFV